jgi:hypothetical protein
MGNRKWDGGVAGDQIPGIWHHTTYILLVNGLDIESFVLPPGKWYLVFNIKRTLICKKEN